MYVILTGVLFWLMCSIAVIFITFIEHKLNPHKIYDRGEIQTISALVIAGPVGLIFTIGFIIHEYLIQFLIRILD